MAKQDFSSISVKADIDADGDVFIYSKKDKKYHYIGYLKNEDFDECPICPVPNPCYIKAKKYVKSKNN